MNIWKWRGKKRGEKKEKEEEKRERKNKKKKRVVESWEAGDWGLLIVSSTFFPNFLFSGLLFFFFFFFLNTKFYI